MHVGPMVSIIIPCRNEVRFIATCLDSILDNGFPLERLEILVVDGMSEDGTREIVDHYAARYEFIKLARENTSHVASGSFSTTTPTMWAERCESSGATIPLWAEPS